MDPASPHVESAGVTAYIVYNHMLLPVAFESLEADYWHLKEHVQVWDVASQRQVELRGPDATRLMQLMTSRDITSAEPGRCLYAPLVGRHGGVVNDPVILKISDDRYWISIADSDVLITTAQVFGRKPPVIVTRDMVEGMRTGSVVVDMAAETGGNVEGSAPDQTVQINGVTVIGQANLPNDVCRDASQMYASNLYNLVEDNWDQEAAKFDLNFEDDILPGCIITHGGEITNDTIKNILEGGA